MLHTACTCSTDVCFITYTCIGKASPTATMSESVNPIHTTLILVIVFGVVCGMTLITILVLVSYLLHVRIKRKQKPSEFQFVAQSYLLLSFAKNVILSEHPKQTLEMKFSNPDPTYDNAQEILMVERTQAEQIRTEACVAYASVAQAQ